LSWQPQGNKTTCAWPLSTLVNTKSQRVDARMGAYNQVLLRVSELLSFNIHILEGIVTDCYRCTKYKHASFICIA